MLTLFNNKSFFKEKKRIFKSKFEHPLSYKYSYRLANRLSGQLLFQNRIN